MFLNGRQHNNDQGPAVAQRFEAKYLIRTADAMAVREHISPFMAPDAHGQEYPVTSIYLDSPDLNMYWSSANGEERRQKLRVRTYARGEDTVCFFEVKRRINQIIRKQRAEVRHEFANSLMAGAPIHPEMLVNPDRDMKNLYAFCDIREALAATPRVVVRYMREAYVGLADEPLRITFDHNLTCLPSDKFDPARWAASPYWFEPPGSPIVLEVKFTDTFPIWVGDIIRRLNLMRISFAKYVVCVDAIQAAGVGVAGCVEGYA